MLWLVGCAASLLAIIAAPSYWWAFVVVSIGCLVKYFVTGGKRVLDADAAIAERFSRDYALNNDLNSTKKTRKRAEDGGGDAYSGDSDGGGDD